ncbi:hypothetical protein A2U01_0020368, partial [Trifolium medium]|nr:hypothetical protein [Trifolium medium]
ADVAAWALRWGGKQPQCLRQPEELCSVAMGTGVYSKGDISLNSFYELYIIFT